MKLPSKSNTELLKEIENKYKEMICKRLKKYIAFTDAWSADMDERELDESELLAGELSATTFTVGRYTVRIAMRVFKVPEYNEALTENDYRIPADKKDLESAKNLSYVRSMPKKIIKAMNWSSYREFEMERQKLNIVHEVKARYNAESDDTFKNKFKYVCEVDHRDSISLICTAKEKSLSDDYASLFTIKHISGAWGSSEYLYLLDTHGALYKFGNESW